MERVAAEFGQVGDEADALIRRLRVVGNDSGPAIWRGEAAEAFRRLLAETEPDLVKLSTSHGAAEGAMRRYAFALGDAQDDARQALADGTRASADKHDAEGRRDQARGEADNAAWTARAAEVRLQSARAQSLLAVADPAYQAQLQQYADRIRVQRDQARAQEADGRRKQAAAQSNVDDAGVRFEAAKRLAHQAAQLRDSAARTAARELTTPADRPSTGAMSSSGSGRAPRTRSVTSLRAPSSRRGSTSSATSATCSVPPPSSWRSFPACSLSRGRSWSRPRR